MHMDVQPFLPTMRDAASPALLRVGWCHFVDVQEPEGLSSPEDCCTIASVLQAFEDDAHACNSPGGGALHNDGSRAFGIHRFILPTTRTRSLRCAKGLHTAFGRFGFT